MSIYFAAKSPEKRIDEYTIRCDLYTSMLEATGMNGTSYTTADVHKAWSQMKAQGWTIVRIQLVEVWSKK